MIFGMIIARAICFLCYDFRHPPVLWFPGRTAQRGYMLFSFSWLFCQVVTLDVHDGIAHGEEDFCRQWFGEEVSKVVRGLN